MDRVFSRAALIAAALLPFVVVDASAQQRQRMPSREQLGEQRPQISGPQEKNFPLGAAWTAITLNGKPLSGLRATLIVDQNLRATGFGGCNTYSASGYPLKQQGFAVGPIALTKRDCGKALEASERSFLTALRGANKWDLVEGRLVLRGGAGELRFDRAL